VDGIANEILRGAAFQTRIQRLRMQGVWLPASVSTYRPGAAANPGAVRIPEPEPVLTGCPR
jgi:hypothetical protein